MASAINFLSLAAKTQIKDIPFYAGSSMIRISRALLLVTCAASVVAGCAGRGCDARPADAGRPAAAHPDAALVTDAASDAVIDADVDGAAAQDACADAAVRVGVELVVRPRVEQGMGSEDTVDEYDPVFSVHVSQLPSPPSGTDRSRQLFTIPDLDPLDGCHAEVRDGGAFFECERGGHPSARVVTEDGAVRIEVTRAAVTRVVERVPLPKGACAQLAASYRQNTPRFPDGPRLHRVDPFVDIAASRSDPARVQSPGRCADAGSGVGPTIDVQIILPGRGTTKLASLFVPAQRARRSLDVFPANASTLCDAHVFPRSAVAILRCYDAWDNGTTQATILFDQGELSTGGGRKTQNPDTGNILLPCNSRVHYVIRRSPSVPLPTSY